MTPRVSDETSDPKGRLVGLHVTCGVARAKEAEDAGAERPNSGRPRVSYYETRSVGQCNNADAGILPASWEECIIKVAFSDASAANDDSRARV